MIRQVTSSFPTALHCCGLSLVAQTLVCLQCRRSWFDPWVGKLLWRRKWQSTPVFLPGDSHGWRSLAGYSPWCHKESDMTEPLHFHFLSFFSLLVHSYKSALLFLTSICRLLKLEINIGSRSYHCRPAAILHPLSRKTSSSLLLPCPL